MSKNFKLEGVITVLTDLVINNPFDKNDTVTIESLHNRLSVSDAETVRELAEALKTLDEDDRMIILVALTNNLVERLNAKLDSSNLEALISLKITLVKLLSYAVVTGSLFVLVHGTLTGNFEGIKQLGDLVDVFENMFFK